MKITLISTAYAFWAVGVRSLAACLKRSGYQVQTIFLLSLPVFKLQGELIGLFNDRILDGLSEFCIDSDLVGISLTTSDFQNALRITRKIKEKKGVPVIWGGIHPTIRPEESLRHADIVCIGEGEEAVVEVADALEHGKSLRNIKGIAFNEGKKVVMNQQRPLLENLDSLPFPDYSDNTDYVLGRDEEFHKVNKAVLEEYIMSSKQESGGAYIAIPSRGCPFGCTYCANNTLNRMFPAQNPIRRRSINNIMQELRDVKKKLPYIKFIRLLDDAFFLFPDEEIEEFARQYKRDIALPLFVFGITPTTITRRKMETLISSGMDRARMGIQSGSERILKLYKRNYTPEQVRKAVGLINEFSHTIKLPYYDIIVDNPWEEEKDIVESLMFFASLPVPFAFTVYSLTLYPGTELYQKAKLEGILSDDLEDVYYKNYQHHKGAYLNKLFYLLEDYTKKGRRISPRVMGLLTSRVLRKTKISLVIYSFLKIWADPSKPFKRFNQLLIKGFGDLRRGDISRIKKFVRSSKAGTSA